MSDHLPSSELEWYVTTGLECALRGWPSERLERIEGHASECAICARALEREACAELALQELAAEPVPRPARIVTWLASAALVAGLVVFVAMGRAAGHDARSPSPNPGAVTPLDAGVASPADTELALDARLR